MRQCQKNRRRSGLTIVEMLVAMALAIFLMAVLTEAFVLGLTAFRQMKAAADMDQQLRQASTIFRKDLAANHFEGDRKPREIIPTGVVNGYLQYGEGFALDPDSVFRPGVREGGDAYSFGSVRDINDWLAFTVRLNGNRAENQFLGRVPLGSPLDGYGYANSRWDLSPQTYASQWAEVIYFLRLDPLGLTTAVENAVDAGGTPLTGLPLYHLFRRQRLLAPDNFATGTTGGTGTTLQSSPATTIDHAGYDVASYQTQTGPNGYKFTSPADIQFPAGLKAVGGGNYQWDAGRRFRPILSNSIPPNTLNDPALNTVATLAGFPRLVDIDVTRAGADLLLTNVLSFDVKVWDPEVNAFVDLGFGIPPSSTSSWTATPQTLTNARPLGRPPVRLDYPGIPPTPNPLAIPNTWHPTQQIYSNAWVYDTWTRRLGGGDVAHPLGWAFADSILPVGTLPSATHHMPYPAGIQAIQIKLRLWDRKTNQTREVTIIQDM